MAIDNSKINGTPNAFKSDAGGATLIREPVIGIVKNNIDPTRSGKIDVYVGVLGGTDPDDDSNWVKGVRYLSPFYGTASPNGDPTDGPDKSGNGAFVGNPQSYGFWASAPDIGTEVICIFVNGRQDQGYYIGCVPKPGLLQMTPALGAANNVVPNATEGTTYGGCDRLPTSEINLSNPELKKSVRQYADPKAIHSYQASIFSAQGLTRDPLRGPISSSAQRETPSRVFGMSTPGGPIFEGGYTSQTIRSAAKTADPAKLKQIGRTGGHTFVMDDGTFDGADQLMRLRTSGGHQIMMNDSGQVLFIIHSNGQSWIELGKEGTIDMYATNSFNVRTQGDINLHADRNININADKDLNLYGENINIESSKATNQRVGTNFSSYTMGTFTLKVDGAMSQSSLGQASYLSSAETFINGSKVNLNSGFASLAPAVVPVIQKTQHLDTTNSPECGWMQPSPMPLVSITNRAPAHQPWVGSGVGVNVKVESTPPPPSEQTTPAADAVNASTPEVPSAPTSPSEVAAVPTQIAAVGPMTGPALQATVSQVATNAQATIASGGAASNIIGAASGLSTGMAESVGLIKPGGAGLRVTGLVANGMSMEKALSSVGTGLGGLNSATLFADAGKQAEAVANSVKDTTNRLMSTGVLTGSESPAQAAGLVLAGTTQGIAALNKTLTSGVASTTAMANDIASGKFAGGLADGAAGGLKTSLTGLIDGAKDKVIVLGDSVANLKDNLKTGLQNAYSAVEKSFGKLKAGMPNKLGPADNSPPAEKSDTAKSALSYESAQLEVESATDALFAAKRDFRNDPTPENQTKLQTTEAALSAARQKLSQSGTTFLKTAGSLATPPGLDKLKTSLNSGLNALPGGAAVLQSIVNKSPVGAAIGQATTAMSMVNGAMAQAQKLATSNPLSGDLLGQAKNAVDGMVNKVTAGLPDIKAGSAGIMAQLEASMGAIPGGASAIKSAEAAVGTYDKSAIVAKVGQLLGDPKIPAPFFSDTPPIAKPDQMSSEIASAYEAVKEAGYKVSAAKLNLSMATTAKNLPGGDTRVADATEGLNKEEAALKVAQAAYSALISA
jgi:hypothetical protein